MADVGRPEGNDPDRGGTTSRAQRRPNQGRARRDARVDRGAGPGRRDLRRRGRAIHLHPRDPEGRETLDAGVVDKVVREVRSACGVPVGVTTSAEIEPYPERRLGLVRNWREPDYASVNLSEPGALELMEALVGIGVGIEAGVWTVEDAERLAASGLGRRVTRILVEPGELQLRQSEDKAADALGLVEDIHRALNAFGLTSARLQHGDGRVTWVLLRDAVRRASTPASASKTRCAAPTAN